MAIDITELSPFVRYTASGGQTVFAYPFPIYGADELVVYKNDVVQTLTAHYMVSGVGLASGGNVTFDVAATAGDEVVIYRRIPLERSTHYGATRAFTAEALNTDLNRLEMQLQELRAAIQRAPGRVPEDWAGAQMTLPDADTSKVLGWSMSGQLANVDPDAVGTGAAALNSVIPGGTRTVTTMQDYLLNNAVHNVKDYGAIGNGATNDTAAIQAAVDAATAAGGGTVYVPPGSYLIQSSILLDSNITLWMDPAAIMIRNWSSGGRKTIENRTYPTYPRDGTIHEYQTNITIIGGEFRAANSSMLGGHIGLQDVGNCRIFGVKATSWYKFWCVHVYGNDIQISHLFLDNTVRTTNPADNGDDGLHIEGGTRILIDNCLVVTGDDALAIANDVIANDEGVATYFNITNVAVSNCYLDSTRSSALSIGLVETDAAASQICYGIAVSNCVIRKTNNSGFALRIGDERGSTSGVFDIVVSNVSILAEGDGRSTVYVNNASNVSLSQVRSLSGTGGGPGFQLTDSANVTLLDCRVQGRSVASNYAIQATSCTGVKIYGGTYGNTQNVHNVLFDACDDVRLSNVIFIGVLTGLTGAWFKDTTNFAVDGCRFNKGAAQTPSGCIIFSGTTDRYTFANNDTADCSATILAGSTFPQNARWHGNYDLTVPTVASAASLTLSTISDVMFISGTATITSITAGWAGRVVTLIFTSTASLTDGSNLKLAGNFTATADDVVRLVCDGTNWFELSRSVN